MYIPRNHYGFDLFDDFFNDSFWSGSQPAQTKKDTGLMRADILDGGSCYLVDIELPGYRKDEIQAELKDGYLTISAVHSEGEETGKNYVRRERYHGSMRRTFYVGEALRQEDIKAAFENGVLRLTVPKEAPKPEEKGPRYINID